LPRVIEWRWAGDNRTAGNSWPNDRCRGRAGCAAASCRAASGRTFGLGSWPVRALAVAGSQWAMEGPLGAGDINRVGAPRADSVTTAGTRSGANPQRGGGVACGEDRGRGVKPVSAAALGVGRHDGPTARVVPVWLGESFVDRQRFSGASYRAANWQAIGWTRGFAKRQGRFVHHGQSKEVYVYVMEARNRSGTQRVHRPVRTDLRAERTGGPV